MSSMSSGGQNPVPYPEPIEINVEGGQTLRSTFDTHAGHHKVTCDLCGFEIALSEKGNAYALRKHRRSKNCQKLAKRREKQQEVERIVAIRNSIGRTSAEFASQSATPHPSPLQNLHVPPSLSGTSTPIHTPSASIPASSIASPSTPSTPLLGHTPGLAAGGVSMVATSQTTNSPARDMADDAFHDLCSSLAGFRDVHECPGVLVEWSAGSVWSTYPYHRHESNSLPWEPIAFENNHFLRIRSDNCLRTISGGDEACRFCAGVPESSRFAAIAERAVSAPAHTTWIGLNYAQMYALLRKTVGQLRQARLKVCTDSRLFSIHIC